jgi:hypothetical protein
VQSPVHWIGCLTGGGEEAEEEEEKEEEAGRATVVRMLGVSAATSYHF